MSAAHKRKRLMTLDRTVYPAEYLEFIKLFNNQEFFEAHEVLESLWLREHGEGCHFYQGLIQIAAVFVHIQKGTPEGGKHLLKTAAKHFEKYRPVHMGLDLEKLLAETERHLLTGGELPSLSLAVR